MLRGAGKPGWDMADRSFEASNPRSVSELAAPGDWTQGWVQPARAPPDAATIIAEKTAQELSSFQRNEPIIANGRLKIQNPKFKIRK